MTKQKNLIILGLVGIAFILFVIFIYLPYANSQSEKSKITESIQHSHKLQDPMKKIPAFSFVNQNGNTITNNSVEGKVYVADFFYTSCEAACPMMTTELTKVQNSINKSAPFRIVSYSLDPENDSVPVLRSFAKKFNAIDSIWYFLTGPKEEIYALGKDGYLQTVLDDSASFVNHTQKLILVDKDGMIRGFYNALDSVDIQLLIRDINYLIYKTTDNEPTGS